MLILSSEVREVEKGEEWVEGVENICPTLKIDGIKNYFQSKLTDGVTYN